VAAEALVENEDKKEGRIQTDGRVWAGEG